MRKGREDGSGLRRIRPGWQWRWLRAPAARQLALFVRFAIAEIGTSVMPRSSAPRAQLDRRSIVTGSALAEPTAWPRARAIDSSLVNALSMSTALGEESRTVSARAKGMLCPPEICPATLRGEDPSSK